MRVGFVGFDDLPVSAESVSRRHGWSDRHGVVCSAVKIDVRCRRAKACSHNLPSRAKRSNEALMSVLGRRAVDPTVPGFDFFCFSGRGG